MNAFTLPVEDAVLSGTVIAPQQPRAILVLVHGMAEHKERYYPFMTYLAEHGFACVITDLRGHGASAPNPEELGHFGKKGAEKLVQDGCAVIRWARGQYPGLKLFLFGHSMGSLIVRSLAKDYDSEIDGLIVCGSPSDNPFAGLGIGLTWLMQLFKGSHYRSKTIAMMMFGPYEKRFQAEGTRNAWLSTNRANVQAYNNDPLCGFKFTLNGYRTVMRLIRKTYAASGWQVNNPELPIHFVAGSQDPCIQSASAFAKAVSFIRNRGYKNVSSKLYPGMRHEILNELGREDVWRDIRELAQSWL